MRMCCLIVPRTQSCSPAPIRLLTNEPQVDANAIAIINGIPDTFRIMFAIAKERSPKCSTNRKNINQVDKETKFWIIVHTETFSIRFSVFPWNLGSIFNADFLQSIRFQV